MKESCRKKYRTEEEKKKLTKRINIIEGQINGIKQMINDDRYCSDILIQISAINNSLKSLGNEILKNHLSTCIVNDIKNDKLEAVDEIIYLFKIMNK